MPFLSDADLGIGAPAQPNFLSDADVGLGAQSGTQPSIAADVAKSGGIGLAKGAIGLAGLPGDINNAISDVSAWAAKKLGANTEDVDRQTAASKAASFIPTSQGIQSKIEGYTGKFYEPQTTAGKYAQTVGEFAPAAFGGEATLGSRLLRMVTPAVGSEAAGQATSGTALEPYARVAGAVAGGAGAAALKDIGAAAPAAAATPTATELKAAAQAGYQAPEVAAVAIKPDAVRNLSAQIQNDLIQRGFRPTSKSASDTFGEVQGLVPGRNIASVSVADIDSARKALGNLAKGVDAVGQTTPEAAAASRAISHIDQFLPNLNQADLLAGDATRANAILQEARANYKAYKQSSLVTTKADNAALQAASTYGGGNLNNATRQAFRPLLRNNAAGAQGFSPEALEQLNTVVTGTPTGNIMRQVGRFSPDAVVPAMLHVGTAAMTGGASLPIAAATYGAKKIGEAMTRSEVNKLGQIVRQQSPLYRQRASAAAAAAPPAAIPANPYQRALVNAVLGRQPGEPVDTGPYRLPAPAYP